MAEQFPDRAGRVALHYAALDGDVPTLHMALRQQDQVDVTDKRGYTPLHFASQANSASAVTALLDAGADPNAITTDGKTPLYLAVFYYRGDGSTVQALLAGGSNADHVLAAGVTVRSFALSIANWDVGTYFTTGRAEPAAGCAQPAPTDPN